MTDMDPSKVSTTLSDSAQAKIISTRIRVARNLSMFPLNPGAGPGAREKICNMMEKVYGAIEASSELKGTMFLHTKMTNAQRQGPSGQTLAFRSA